MVLCHLLKTQKKKILNVFRADGGLKSVFNADSFVFLGKRSQKNVKSSEKISIVVFWAIGQ